MDESAIKAVEKWKFAPGRKDGKPVKILATVEVKFQLDRGGRFPDKEASQRTKFNLAVQSLNSKDTKQVERAAQNMADLANEKYPPAQHAYSKILDAGLGMHQDKVLAAQLLEQAANAKYAPAMYEFGRKLTDGTEVQQDTARGRALILQAATLGNDSAQYFVGAAMEMGTDYPKDLEKSREFFRLCAARGLAPCQFRLGSSILTMDKRRESDYTEGIAWLQLASDAGETRATDQLSRETYPAGIAERVKEIKPKLVQKR